MSETVSEFTFSFRMTTRASVLNVVNVIQNWSPGFSFAVDARYSTIFTAVSLARSRRRSVCMEVDTSSEMWTRYLPFCLYPSGNALVANFKQPKYCPLPSVSLFMNSRPIVKGIAAADISID